MWYHNAMQVSNHPFNLYDKTSREIYENERFWATIGGQSENSKTSLK